MYGISVRNDSNHILVSSDIRSFHFIGQASHHANIASGLTTFDNYGDRTTVLLSGRCIYTYRITAVNTQAPLVFIRPGTNLNRYGVLRSYYDAGYWYFDIIQSGPNYAYPTVYCFAQLTSVTTPVSDTGLVTYLSNGEVAFDSGRRPLAIHDAQSTIPPAMPSDTAPVDYSYGNWNISWFLTSKGDFKNDTTYNTYDVVDATRSEIAFLAPSIAQAVTDHTYYGFYKSCGTYSCQEHKAWTTFWAMYQAAYGLEGSGATLKLTAGWSVMRAGYYFSQSAEDGGWFGGGGGSYTSGDRPYAEKTINHFSNPIILINASHYDA